MHHFQLSIQLSITLQSGPSVVEPQGHEQPAHFGFTRPDANKIIGMRFDYVLRHNFRIESSSCQPMLSLRLLQKKERRERENNLDTVSCIVDL